MNLRACRALVLATLVAGCATIEEVPKLATETTAVRTYIRSIELDGRLSARYQHDGNDEALHGNFSWQQAPGRTSITLTSPLGQTLAIIEVEPHRAILRQAGQPARAATDADALAAEALGWPLPVAGLRDWLQGFATDAQGRPWIANSKTSTEIVTQDGWHIVYVGWQENGGKTFPKRIDLTRKTAQAGPVAIRIVIDHWQAKP